MNDVLTLQCQELWALAELPPCLLKWKNQYSGLLSSLSDVIVSGISVEKTQLMGSEQRSPKPFSAFNRLTMGESKKAEKFLPCPQLIYTFLIEVLFILSAIHI